MNSDSTGLVVVFPISATAFGFRPDWFQTFSARMIHPAFLLMTMLIVVSVAVLALKRFEHADFDKKVWNYPVLISLIIFWPPLVLGLKNLVDTFNTFLVVHIFRIPWHGFGFPEIGSIGHFAGWSAEGLARLIPNIAYWIIYAFYMIFFFFDAVLGPLVLAKGVLFDETAAFLELAADFSHLLLWQTTVVVLVAMIMPDIVSGRPFPAHPENNYYFLSLILGVMIFFVPTITRKFGYQIGSAFVPLGFRWSGAMLGLTALSRVSSLGLSGAGLALHQREAFRSASQRVLKADEFRTRYDRRKKIQDLDEERRTLEEKLHEDYENETEAREAMSESTSSLGLKKPEVRVTTASSDKLLELSKKAKLEMKEEEEE